MLSVTVTEDMPVCSPTSLLAVVEDAGLFPFHIEL